MVLKVGRKPLKASTPAAAGAAAGAGAAYIHFTADAAVRVRQRNNQILNAYRKILFVML